MRCNWEDYQSQREAPDAFFMSFPPIPFIFAYCFIREEIRRCTACHALSLFHALNTTLGIEKNDREQAVNQTRSHNARCT